jgi:small ligand-binding sensory domain FIST
MVKIKSSHLAWILKKMRLQKSSHLQNSSLSLQNCLTSTISLTSQMAGILQTAVFCKSCRNITDPSVKSEKDGILKKDEISKRQPFAKLQPCG